MRVSVRNCQLSFADIRKPKDFKGKITFNANGICSEDTTLIVTKDDNTVVTLGHRDAQRIINTVCTEKWGSVPPKLKNWAYNKADGSGTRDKYINKDGDYHEGYDADTWFFASKTLEERAPDGIMIVDQKRNPLPASKGHPVSGDYVTLLIDIYAFEDADGDKGVTASLQGVQMLKKGKPFGKSAPPQPSAFAEEELEDDDEDDATADDVDGLI